MAPSDARGEPAPPAFLVLDTESVPDGRLLARVRYPGESLSPPDAVARARAEARSSGASDFLPVSFHYPVAACVIRVGADLGLQAITCLDAPLFRPRKIVEAFWAGLANYRERHRDRIRLVTFNGRLFDLPLLELAAFRYGCGAREYFATGRLGQGHLDLLDFLSNCGEVRLAGGLNLLSKLLGKPGKMEVGGEQVYQMFLDGKAQQINDYCVYDALDTYFVLLRTRVLTGEMTLEQEHLAAMKAKAWLTDKARELPALAQYLDNWGEWDPWP